MEVENILLSKEVLQPSIVVLVLWILSELITGKRQSFLFDFVFFWFFFLLFIGPRNQRVVGGGAAVRVQLQTEELLSGCR